MLSYKYDQKHKTTSLEGDIHIIFPTNDTKPKCCFSPQCTVGINQLLFWNPVIFAFTLYNVHCFLYCWCALWCHCSNEKPALRSIFYVFLCGRKSLFFQTILCSQSPVISIHCHHYGHWRQQVWQTGRAQIYTGTKNDDGECLNSVSFLRSVPTITNKCIPVSTHTVFMKQE